MNGNQSRTNVDLVTLTFGGNDAQFANVLSACANVLQKRLDSCLPRIAPANLGISRLREPANESFYTWAQLFEDLLASAPNAEILVVGYPRFFSADIPQQGCGGGGGTDFSEAEMIALNQAADQANRAMQSVIDRMDRRIRFVDVGRAFEGHGVCDDESWLNRAIPTDAQQSFHPNISGQQAIAEAVSGCFSENICSASSGQRDPTLGLPRNAPAQGFGTTRPDVIDLGGASSTGVVTDIEWDGWGEERAEGRGIGAYVPPDGINADAQRESARVVAFDLGPCEGVTVYRKVTWFFPDFGEVFDAENATDTCDE